MKLILIIIFLVGLTYVLVPSPKAIDDFPPLPESFKSDEPGDTVQVPNVSAYFSDLRRGYVTSFYKDSLQNLTFNLIPPIKLNHPPELANQYIRDQQMSTFLEEYSYPLRESLFVNGYEPFDQKGKPFNREVFEIVINGIPFDSKTTLKYYPSSVIVRIFVYFGIWVALILLFELTKRAIREI